MKEQFIPYELALKLKELGFDEGCLTHYCNHWKDLKPYLWELNQPDYDEYWDLNSKIKAPLWQQAFDWFREKYDLLGYVQDESSINDNVNIYDKWMYVIQELPIILHDDLSDDVLYKTYQEARQACLEKLIEIVRNKK